MSYKVIQNTEENRFEINEGGFAAVLEYELQDGNIIFTHTGVPRELEGKGIGSALVKYALEYATGNQLKVVPECPFVQSYIDKHPL